MALGYFYADQSPEQLDQRRQAINAMIFAGYDGPRSPAEGAVRGLSKVVGAWKKRGIDKTEAAQRAKAQSDVWGPIQQALSGGGNMSATSPSAASWNPFGGSTSGASDMQQAAQNSSAAQAIESVAPSGGFSGGQDEFIAMLAPEAIKASEATGVDPRIIIAQAAQESGWGKHAPGNNLFGIKSHGQSGGNQLATTEYVNGKPIRITDSFRSYDSPSASVSGYADFINRNPRYQPFKSAQGLDAQLAALGESGYATDPNYASSVGSIARGIDLTPYMPQRGDRVTGAVPPPQNFPERLGANTPPQSPSQAFASQSGTPAPAMQPPQDVASMQVASVQPQQPQAPVQPSAPQQQAYNGPSDQMLIQAMTNPWLSDQQRAVAQSMWQQRQQANDPMRQLQMQKAQLEINNLRNPQPKPTDDMREYEFARSQGYQGSFQDFMTEMKRAGASSTTVNNNMKGETKFDEEFGKNLATRAIDIMDAGQQAPSKIAQYQALGSALQNTYTGTGGDAILSARRAAQSLGIDLGDVGDGEFAKALGNQIALQLRSPSGGAGMPGALSDKDREFLVSMVPNLQKTPEGNARLVDMMTKVEQRNMQVSQLARDYMSRNGGRLDYGFYDELAQWSNQNPLFPDAEDPAQAPSGNTTSSGVKWSIE